MNRLLVIVCLCVLPLQASLQQEETVAALFRAITLRDINGVLKVLAEGVDVNIPAVDGRLPLLKAAAVGDKRIVKTLLERGA